MDKAIFLDRDGVVNYERGEYTYLRKDFTINVGLIEFLRSAINANYLIIIISNQGGIAKGIYSKNDVEGLHQYLTEILLAKAISLTDIFYCPHYPDFGVCLCRKPGSLLLEKALAKYNIDPAKSLFIGDGSRDIEAAKKVGIEGILVDPNQDLKTLIKLISNGS